MNDTSRGEILDEASNWIVGGGIVTMALFPLALPGIILTVAAAIPLAAAALAVIRSRGGQAWGHRSAATISRWPKGLLFVPAGPIHGAGGPSPKLIGYDPASRG